MPELPDVTVYVEALRERVVGKRLERMRFFNPFVLRSVEPPKSAFEGGIATEIRRIGKRIAIGFEGGLFFVIHLMIAGRLRWSERTGAKPPGKIGHAAFDFENGTLLLTEASSHKRATVHFAQGEQAVAAHDPGGVEPLECSQNAFAEQLRAENRTLKRALTNPKRFSGIGNAYSDEILFAARLSPVRLTSSLSDEEVSRLHEAVRSTLQDWTDRLRHEFAGRFPGPGQITAFRPDFAVHGRFGLPCPVCGTKVQRIRYAENETNYCARCQNEGRMLADRSLSRLLRDDWPKTIEEMEGT
jgi:formamidopyrimidine-DNA glycosylase